MGDELHARVLRGRPPRGIGLLDGIPGSEHARRRFGTVLKTIADQLSIIEAAAALGMCQSRFHAMRTEFLTAAVAHFEPRRPGPVPRSAEVLALQAENDRLRKENEELRFKVYVARVGEELALVMPERRRRGPTAPSVVKKKRTRPVLDDSRRRSDARRHAAALTRLARRSGRTLPRVASMLGMPTSTLRGWVRAERAPQTHAARGRRRPGRSRRICGGEDDIAVEEFLERHDGRVSVATLHSFSLLPRSRVRWIASRWRRERAASRERLHWPVPETAWAMDWTEMSEPIELESGEFAHNILVVKDLASTAILWAKASVRATALVAAEALASILSPFRTPLVLKTDNGSNVTEAEIPPLLEKWRITHLRSPPRTPRFNGAIEAGVRALKARLSEIHAALHGQRMLRESDIERAAVECNTLVHPWGPRGPTPQRAWSSRRPIREATREAFPRMVRFHALQVASTKYRIDVTKSDLDKPEAAVVEGRLSTLSATQRATVVRGAIRRTLEMFGYLVTRSSASSSTQLIS